VSDQRIRVPSRLPDVGLSGVGKPAFGAIGSWIHVRQFSSGVEASALTRSFTKVYDGLVGPEYHFDERSYQAVAIAGIAWQDVLAVLRTRPQVRRDIGAVRQVAAQAPDGRWLVVVAIEEADDEYLVVSARQLNADEAADAAKMIEGGPR
jgi:hypothetical protein